MNGFRSAFEPLRSLDRGQVLLSFSAEAKGGPQRDARGRCCSRPRPGAGRDGAAARVPAWWACAGRRQKSGQRAPAPSFRGSRSPLAARRCAGAVCVPQSSFAVRPCVCVCVCVCVWPWSLRALQKCMCRRRPAAVCWRAMSVSGGVYEGPAGIPLLTQGRLRQRLLDALRSCGRCCDA